MLSVLLGTEGSVVNETWTLVSGISWSVRGDTIHMCPNPNAVNAARQEVRRTAGLHGGQLIQAAQAGEASWRK